MTAAQWVGASIAVTLLADVALIARGWSWRVPAACLLYAASGLCWWCARRVGGEYVSGSTLWQPATYAGCLLIGLVLCREQPTPRGWVACALCVAALAVAATDR